MRALESFELELVGGGSHTNHGGDPKGNAWGHKYNPNNPHNEYAPGASLPEGAVDAPNGIKNKYNGDGVET
jgi:hypothetical protein